MAYCDFIGDQRPQGQVRQASGDPHRFGEDRGGVARDAGTAGLMLMVIRINTTNNKTNTADKQ